MSHATDGIPIESIYAYIISIMNVILCLIGLEVFITLIIIRFLKLNDYSAFSKKHVSNDFESTGNKTEEEPEKDKLKNLEMVGPISFIGCILGSIFMYKSEAAKHRFQVEFDYYFPATDWLIPSIGLVIWFLNVPLSIIDFKILRKARKTLTVVSIGQLMNKLYKQNHEDDHELIEIKMRNLAKRHRNSMELGMDDPDMDILQFDLSI